MTFNKRLEKEEIFCIINLDLKQSLKMFRSALFIIFLVFLKVGLAWSQGNTQPPANVSVAVVWGKQAVEHPLVKVLLESAIMKRLKHIDQSGPVRYFGYSPPYSRYEHSVGVWALLIRFNCPFAEQIAGLLHDSSHTVFSHVADHLFAQPQSEHSYQDTIHLWFLEKMQVSNLLTSYGLTLPHMNPDLPEYRGLEQSLPDMCADRIEYNLHTGLLFKRITQDELNQILDDLRFENSQWFFVSIESAKKFAHLSLYFTEYHWGAAWNFAFYHYFKEILQRAMELKVITSDQIHFGTDQEVLNILLDTADSYIQKRIQACRCIHQSFTVGEKGEGKPIDFKPKFRGIDPLVMHKNALYRLTTLDSDFQKSYEALKIKCKQGAKVWLKTFD